jgi:hypothetical protein
MQAQIANVNCIHVTPANIQYHLNKYISQGTFNGQYLQNGPKQRMSSNFENLILTLSSFSFDPKTLGFAVAGNSVADDVTRGYLSVGI